MKISRIVQSAIVTLALAAAPALASANNTHGQMQSSQTSQSQSMRQGVKGNASDRAANTNIRGYQDERGNVARGERARTGQQSATQDFSGAKPPITSANANTNTRMHGALSQGRVIGGGPQHAQSVRMDHPSSSSGGQSQRSTR